MINSSVDRLKAKCGKAIAILEVYNLVKGQVSAETEENMLWVLKDNIDDVYSDLISESNKITQPRT
ncbi:hypothetical protein ACLMPM_19660 [Yersinia enterocolitica]|uniref:hypothetical protein n=1 Tax=Yersinia enterocolitica TaxID=630 RepID=UPI00398D2C9E